MTEKREMISVKVNRELWDKLHILKRANRFSRMEQVIEQAFNNQETKE